MDVLTDPPFALPECTLLPAAPVEEFDQMAALTRRVIDAPTATVTLVDQQSQIFPGAAGLNELQTALRSEPRAFSFCQYVVTWAEPLIVEDAREHPLLRDNPAIVQNNVIAYAGMPLRDLQDRVIGSLCVLDSRPRQWSAEQIETLRQLSIVCSAQLQLVESKARAAVLDDRDRMAVDLRESVVRELLELSLLLGNARSQAGGPVASLMDDALRTVDRALSELRVSIYGRRRTGARGGA